MKASTSVSKTIDEYLCAFPAAVQQKLEGIRQTIKQVALEADEAISYGMPTFVLC